MIDPTDFTNYDRSDGELEETIFFCLCVAGHNAKTTSKHLDRFLQYTHSFEPITEDWQPFISVSKFDLEEIRFHLKRFGIGSHGLRSKGMYYLVNSKINLKECTREELLEVPGIGMKTASYFILHTRKDTNIACLDRHVMRWLQSRGHIVPDNTPPSVKKYLETEKIFLEYAKELKMTPACLDLTLWNESTGVIAKNLLGVSED